MFTIQIGRTKTQQIVSMEEGRLLVTSKIRSARRLPKSFGLVRDEAGNPIAQFSMNGRCWTTHVHEDDAKRGDVHYITGGQPATF